MGAGRSTVGGTRAKAIARAFQVERPRDADGLVPPVEVRADFAVRRNFCMHVAVGHAVKDGLDNGSEIIRIDPLVHLGDDVRRIQDAGHLARRCRAGGRRVGRTRGGIAENLPVAAGAKGAPTGCPHSLQNFAPIGSSMPHAAHVSPSLAPHSRQNFHPGGLPCWHRGHCIRGPSSAPRGDCGPAAYPSRNAQEEQATPPRTEGGVMNAGNEILGPRRLR
jgi:hypothetical protein